MNPYRYFIHRAMSVAEAVTMGMELPSRDMMKMLAIIWKLHKKGQLNTFIKLAEAVKKEFYW